MSNVKFAKSHEWVDIEGDCGTMGITDYAQKQLGDIVYVELPQIGDKIQKSSQFGIIESTKAASELYSPLSCEVVDVNTELVNRPQLINESSQSKGWMVKIRIHDVNELDDLMDEFSYKEYIEMEAD